MELNAEYLRRREPVAFLVCDYYETNQIPREALEVKDNIALFPIDNVPLIDLILTNFVEQDFKNVVIVGSQIDSLVEHIRKTEFLRILSLRIFKTKAETLGDAVREMYHLGYETGDFLVLHANHYTNIPLRGLFECHLRDKRNFMTMFSYPHETNDTAIHMYACTSPDNNIVHYSRVTQGCIYAPEIVGALHSARTVEISYWHSSPTIAVLGREALKVFYENFDFHTLGDMLSGLMGLHLPGLRLQMVSEKEVAQAASLRGDARFYSKEIITMLDYFRFNQDVGQDSTIVGLKSVEYIKEGKKNGYSVRNSVLGQDSQIYGNISDCVVWDNCRVERPCSELIVLSDEVQINVFHLESSGLSDSDISGEPEEERRRGETFFDDVTSFLRSHVATAKVYDIDTQDVSKQLRLLMIVWNASHSETIEAFASFFIGAIDSLDIEESLSRACSLFCVFSDFITTKEDETHLMDALYDSSRALDSDIRAQIFFNYVFLLVDRGIVTKSVVKKYNKMYREGQF